MAGLASITLAAGMALIGSTGAQAAPAIGGGPSGGGPADKIQAELQETFNEVGNADFWIRFADRADLTAASRIDDWVARGEAVAAELRATAGQSQAEVVNLLEDPAQRQVRFQPFWATNAIYVYSGTAGLATQLASYAEVEGLYAPVGYKLDEPTPGEVQNQINAVEWGIANINADDVWDQFGVRGEGITVANIDTGVQFNHPALVAQYRGNLGGGSFDHNYNWFDAAGNCASAPCDLNGHGTHTMGTMAGDDGGVNQIGAAPEANWIAANGCCPSDAALIASGQWMLQPTDLNGQNPDASKRPHIVNNSWGTIVPSNDPFMEDVLEAWAAAGIFGVWSNGNNGPACATSGSPGSRILNYSVGAYNISNTIAGFSSRGPGQSGETKPNLAAPGVDVRSSVPGSSYASFNGTSMAAPHVAGSIALLWSAAPSLVGDIAATRALLDDTAVDTENLQCGGTADDNNVFGEGRLDALALLQAAPIGDTGELTGTVTDAGTGDPISGATIHVTGDGVDRTLTTGGDGTYSTALTAGDYTVEASAFGYLSQTTLVTIEVGETTVADFALQAAPLVNVTGLIRDGSGHGWPVYAKVNVEGAPDAAAYSNPFTGRYRLQLPANAEHTLTVEPQYPGYLDLTETIVVGSGNLVRDLTMFVDTNACTTAPGYQFGSSGVFETFESGSLPAGWTIVDNIGNGQVWQFNNPGGRSNLTGGEGGFAIVDSDEYGPGNDQDTQLVSPMLDLTNVANPIIQFNQDFNWWVLGLNEFTNVDVSIDGGVTWETVFHQSGADAPGPRQETIEIPQAAGEPDVQVRFHYGNARFEFWWEIDNVLIGELFCVPIDGGLVAGFVRDRNTGAGINGATVTSVDNPDESTTTFATPDDPARDDGFYWMFSSLTGPHPFTASAPSYSPLTRQADVEADWTTQRNFQLAAGQLAVEPGSVEAEIQLGGSAERTVTITNTGTAAASVELSERDGSFTILRADGTEISESEMLASPGAPVRRVELFDTTGVADLAGSFAPLSLPGRDGLTAPRSMPTEAPWTSIANLPRTLMDHNVVTVDGLVYSFGGSTGVTSVADVYVFDPAAMSWTQLDPMPNGPRHQSTQGVIDGKVYLVSGWSNLDTATLIYDPATDGWSTGANAPAARAAAGEAVLDGQLYLVGGCTTNACAPYADGVFRYDPASDSWETLASYPVPTAWQSCGAVGGQVVCAGGLANGNPTTDAFAYDPASNTWTPVADMPVNLWGAANHAANGMLLISGGLTGPSTITNEGYAYDPATDSWSDLPASNNLLFRPGSGCGFYKVGGSVIAGFQPTNVGELLPGFDQCGDAADVPWLEVDPTAATLAPGESVEVTVSMDAEVAQPGEYTAAITIREDTPYSVAPVDVTMNVTPPDTWGKITGTVMATDCGGNTAPLADATVHLSTWAMELTLFSDEDGGYAHWLDFRHSPFFMIVAKDGFQPQFRQTSVSAGEITVEDWNLRAVCATSAQQADQHPM
jgi:subtilisin family serine protease/N-acetylneuraminic acid mutarotase